MEHYSVVIREYGKEIGRSKGMEFEKAIAKVKLFNKKNVRQGVRASYVETTASVKHLPVLPC